jgi:hypothetical protein
MVDEVVLAAVELVLEVAAVVALALATAPAGFSAWPVR